MPQQRDEDRWAKFEATFKKEEAAGPVPRVKHEVRLADVPFPLDSHFRWATASQGDQKKAFKLLAMRCGSVLCKDRL